MNIVFFMQDTGAVFGAERATIDLACGLRDVGECVRFFLIEEARLNGSPRAFRAALDREQLPVATFSVAGRMSRDMAKQVKEAFVRANGDVLHVIGYKANLHAWLAGIHPVVATVHGWLFRRDLKERVYDAVDQWCLRRCDQVICLSSYYERLLQEKGVERERLSLIPSGLRVIPPDDAVAESNQSRPVTFGMMGRFSEEKNHHMFLQAARIVGDRYPDVRFVVAGHGPLETSVRRDAEFMGLTPVIEFCGYQSVETFMSAIDVYVICSKIENLPYSILEAMAWARPVIATRAGGMPDLVQDGITGMLVESGQHEKLAEAMAGLAKDRAGITRMGLAGRDRMLSNFTLRRSVEAHRNIYQRLGRNDHA